MNYKAFYRTYRPVHFDQVIGQDHIVQTLKNILKFNKISHGYLFAGPRGTGKTSVARIFANTLNCIHEAAESICSACLANANQSLDVIEIDAASNNGVNDIRNIREQIHFAPTTHPYKIYIIDEVHMLSKGAFNALLTTLEEPPQHAIFILATTNPDKIPDTVLSRLQTYNFKRITKLVLKEQLKKIFAAEKINFEEAALDLIANLAGGSLRDALSIADQINAYTDGQISKTALMDIFGLAPIENQIQLLNFMIFKNVAAALQYFDQLVNDGIDLNKLVVTLINLLKDFLIYKKTANANLIESTSVELLETIMIKPDFVYQFLEILTPLSSDLKYSEIPQQIFQLAIIKLASLEQTVALDGAVKQIAQQNSLPKTSPLKTTFNQPEMTNNFETIPLKTTNLDFSSVPEITDVLDRENDRFGAENQTILSDFPTAELQEQIANALAAENQKPLENIKNQTRELKPPAEIEQPKIESETVMVFVNDDTETQANQNNANNETETIIFENTFTNTEELLEESTNLLNLAHEADAFDQEINEAILDGTQEIDFISSSQMPNSSKIINSNNLPPNDIKAKKVLNPQRLNPEITEEFDINQLAPKSAHPAHKDNSKKTPFYKLNDLNIINLFMQADKNTFAKFKEKLLKSTLNLEPKAAKFTTLFKDLKFICSAADFLLVSAKENWIVDNLNQYYASSEFDLFIENTFGVGIHFFAITKQEYLDARELYIKLKENNQVPKVNKLPTKSPVVKENPTQADPHKEPEMKARAIFGGLFKKKKY